MINPNNIYINKVFGLLVNKFNKAFKEQNSIKEKKANKKELDTIIISLFI